MRLLSGLLLAAIAAGTAHGQVTVISDNYNVTTAGTGFGLNAGVNTGINPPTTRMTGTAAPNLRYYQTATTRSASKYDIGSNRLRVQTEATIGRFTISANSATPFDFGPALGAPYASATNKATYDIKISMRNDATSTARFSFAIGTAEGDANSWDFGVQLYLANAADTFYQIQKRIDAASSPANADINALMTTTAASTYQTFIPILIRVTDAGPESGANFNSRIQVSLDNGATWVYDTSTDGALSNAFRFDGPGRYIIFDQASNNSGNVFYDSFSIVSTYAPPPPQGRVWSGGGADALWTNPANWDGAAPNNGDPLTFNGTTKQANTNDIVDLTIQALNFNNGGFALYGNSFTNNGTISNVAGINILGADMSFATTGAKTWGLASGSEVQLNNTTTIEVNGDNNFGGGGTLRVKGAMNIGQAPSSAANPPFIINEGKHVVDGGTFASRGGYRIGSQATGAGAQTIVTNGGNFALTVSAAALRVGDSANPITARLDINNSTLTMAAGSLAVSYAAGATGQVSQVGGVVSGPIVNFSQSGAGKGTYAITNGLLETIQIKKTTAGGLAQMYFDNATLRTAGGASNAFFSGINLAEIESGGLILDAQSDVTIGQALTGSGPLVKSNSSGVTLTAANTYSGSTTVKSGRLTLPTVQTNATAVQVADGAELGVILMANGTSLSVPSVSFAGASFSTLSFDLGTFGTPSAPLMKVSSLSVAGPVTINILNGQQVGLGQFVLVKYSGSISGGFNFNPGTLPSGMTANLVNNTANSSIDLNVTAVPGLRWTGANNGEWDGSTENWLNKQTGLPSAYFDGVPIEFLDGAANPTINISGFPSPNLITVSNNSLPYVWSSPAGALTVTQLKKSGTGSLTRIENGADIVGGIELNGGSFIVSNVVDGPFATTLTDTTPGGTFVKDGPSAMTLSSTNSTYDGIIAVKQGTLKVANGNALGRTNGGTVIASGATLDLNDQVFPGEPVTVAGSGDGGIGAIIDSTSAGAVANNLTDVTMTNDTTFGAPNASGRWDIRVRAATGPGPGLKGNGFNLTKVGPGFVSIACQRNLGAATPYWNLNLGDVTINEGALAFAESLTLGNPSKIITVNSGCSLQFFDLNVTNPMPRNIVMTDAQLTFSGGSTDTNILNGSISMTGAIKIRPDQAVAILNGPLFGSGSLNMSAVDPGRVFLNGANTYAGDTTVTNGTLGGSGSITGNLVMLGGTNSPGMGVGTFTVGGNAKLAGATLMELNGNLSPNSDRLVVNGTLTFGGVLQVVLGAGAPAPQVGDVYQLFNKGSASSFSAISLPALSGGRTWVTTNLTANGSISVVGPANPPTISSVSVSGNNFIFSGTGGTAGNSYAVIASTDLSLPIASWTPLSTNVFGLGGTFSFTNAMNSSMPVRFYRLRVP